MTRDDLKKSVQDGTKSFMDSVFTSDIYIRRSNVPVFVMTCLMALAGSMLFGMYFAKQEAQALHAKERAELVGNFASIMKDKDEQIDGLTNVLIVNQKSHDKKLDAIGDTTREIAHFLLNSPQPARIKLERLEERVKELQQAVEPTEQRRPDDAIR